MKRFTFVVRLCTIFLLLGLAGCQSGEHNGASRTSPGEKREIPKIDTIIYQKTETAFFGLG